MKTTHEIRDPIHMFIKYSSDERKVIDSSAFQRLRHINQLAFTNLVYPGTTHKRFEHSLGVMELATRIFDTIFNEEKILPLIRELNFIPKYGIDLAHWRAVLRLAALCHDLGHLPFSHASEAALFPDGWDHERMTIEIIKSDEMQTIWRSLTPPVESEEIIKLAIGPKKLAKIQKGISYNYLEAILSEIIVSDIFGADRMDYLLRDSYYAGVAYGKFDHYRLIDTLKILPNIPCENEEEPKETTPFLGVEEGGLHSVEALLLARYFMFSQLYFHHIRRIYDIHLIDFMRNLFPDRIPITIPEYLRWADPEILAEIRRSANDSTDVKYRTAKIIAQRKHYKLIYQRYPRDSEISLTPGKKVKDAMCLKFGDGNVKHDFIPSTGGVPGDFPVETYDGRIISALSSSEVLKEIPRPIIDLVFVARECYDEAKKLLESRREDILRGDKEGK